MATSRSSSKIKRILNLQKKLNLELFPILLALELDVFGVTGKHVKDVVHLGRWNFGK
jgi:hypothetical protein